MSSINPLDGLAEILRRRIASEAVAKGRKLGGAKEAGGAVNAQRASPEALKQRLAEGIEGIALDDPERKKKALRVFVEGVLAWQFGDALLNDRRFAELVSEVQATLEMEPGFVEQLLATLKCEPEKASR
jgi:hypothetical protein